MPIQQLSSGGATAPLAVLPGSGTSSTTTSLTQTGQGQSDPLGSIGSLTQTGNFDYTFPNLNLDSILQQKDYGGPGTLDKLQLLGNLDPFNTQNISPIDTTAASVGASSPGYQKYGADWYNFLDAVNTPSKDPGSITLTNGEKLDISSAGFDANFGTAYDRGTLPFDLSEMARKIGGGKTIASLRNTDPLSVSALGYGGTGNDSLAANILHERQFNSGDAGNSFAALQNQALPQVAAAFGIDPASSQAQKLSQMYVTDVLQSAVKGNTQDYFQATSADRDPLSGISIVRDILQLILAVGTGSVFGELGAASAAQGAGGGAAAAEGGAEGGAATGAAASTPADLATFEAVQAGLFGAKGLASGDPVQIGTSALSIAGAGDNLYGAANSSPGVTGTNSTIAGSISSSLADTLGITPDQLQFGTQAVKGLGTPLVAGLVGGSSGSPSPESSPVATPIGTPAATPFIPSASGTPLTPEEQENPAQRGYKPPEGTDEASLQRLLQELGQS